MAEPIIKVRRSSVPGKIPTADQIQLGEFAVNTFDGKVFIEKDSSSVGIATTVVVVNPWNVGVGTSAYDISFDLGSVAIGKTTPLYDLDVFGDINFTGTLYQNGVPFVSGGGGDSYWIKYATGISTTSNIGIGTTVATDALTVLGSASISGNITLRKNDYLNFGTELSIRHTDSLGTEIVNDSNLGGNDRNIKIVSDFGGDLILQSSSNIFNLGITSSSFNNSVGIGSDLPTEALDIVGSIKFTDNIYGDGSALTGVVTTINVGPYLDIQSVGGISTISYVGPITPTTFLEDGATGVSTTKNVGIGTTSSLGHVLNVVGLTTLNGSVYINGDLNSNGNAIFSNGIGNPVDFTKQNFYGTYYGEVSPTLAQQITTSIIGSGNGSVQYNNGNLFAGDPQFVWNQNTNSLGIGTTSASYNLHVIGDVNFTGNLYENGVVRPKTNWNNIGTSVYVGGLVGIGTTDPTASLDVNGTADISQDLTVGGSVFISGGIDVSGIITASNLKNFEFKGDIITSAVLDEGIDFIADVTFTSKYWSANLVGSAVTESAYYCDMDSSRNVYVVGTTETDVVVAKYDQYGTVQWQTSLSGDGNQRGSSIGVGTTSVYICGVTAGNDGFIARYDFSGNVVWRKSFGYAGVGSTTVTSLDVAESLVVDNSGNAYVVGYGGSVADFEIDIPIYTPNTEILVLKYNDSGDIVWKRSIGGVSLDYGFDISKDSSDNIYICGSTTHESTYTFRTYGLYNSFVAKYNSSGTLQWQRGLGSRGVDHANGVDTDSSGNVYIVGYNIPQESTKSQLFLAKYDSSGTLQWQKFLTDSVFDIRGYSVKVASDNSVYIAGTKSTTTPGEYELIWAKYTSTGEALLKRRVYGKTFTDNVKLNLDDIDNVYLTSSADEDLLVMKFTADGSKLGTYVGLNYGSIQLVESNAGLSTFITTFTEYNATFIGETALNAVGILSVTNYGSGFTTTSNPIAVGIITGFEHSNSFTGLSTGSNLSIDILEVDINGGITSFVINNPGQNYVVGDIVSPLSNTSASFRVVSLKAGTELTNGITSFRSEKTSISKSSFAGNLGLGVSDPNSKLHVVGETKLDGPLNIGGSVGSETIPQTVVSTYENVEWRDLYFEQYELDDLGTAVTGIENTFVPTFNQERVTLYTPYQLNVSIDGIPQPAFLYNTEYVWTSDVLTARNGYTIDYDGNIKFSEAIPMESTIVSRVISGRQSQTKLKKYPFSALDIMMH